MSDALIPVIIVMISLILGFGVGVNLVLHNDRPFEKEDRILDIAKEICEKGNSYPATVRTLEVECADGLILSRSYLEEKLEDR